MTAADAFIGGPRAMTARNRRCRFAFDDSPRIWQSLNPNSSHPSGVRQYQESRGATIGADVGPFGLQLTLCAGAMSTTGRSALVKVRFTHAEASCSIQRPESSRWRPSRFGHRSCPSPTRQTVHLNGCFTLIPARKPTRSVGKKWRNIAERSAIFRARKI